MKILIIEDEPHSARQLQEMIIRLLPAARFEPVIDNVEEAIAWFRKGVQADLLFLDIHLSDGLAFEIFESVNSFLPIIFTTAYDQYAIRAFEVNSIEYLLKPIRPDRLEKALQKAEQYLQQSRPLIDTAQLQQLQMLLSQRSTYRENFLIAFKDRFLPIPVADFAFFEIRNGLVVGTLFNKSIHSLEERSLEDLAGLINPQQFFRVNRQYIVNRAAIREVAQYFNGKLLASLQPAPAEKIIISRERAGSFKEWMSR